DACPPDRPENGPARLGRSDLHRGRGEDAGRDEREVLDAARGRASLVHERAEPDAERAEVEDRVDYAGRERATPRPLVERQPELVRSKRERVAHSSTSVRPVRCKKTSSSVERRTSTLCGARPRPWIPSAVRSPSSV